MRDFTVKLRLQLMLTGLLGCFLLAQSASAAVEIGDILPELTLAAEPQDFVYKINGHAQMLTVYPASLTSSSNGAFNAKVIEAGYCPKSIIDIKNRSWYVPKKMAKRAILKSLEKDTHNPLCTVSIDYKGKAINHWRLNKKSTTIIVNSLGKVIFVAEGILNKAQQQKVIALMTQYGKPYTHWPTSI